MAARLCARHGTPHAAGTRIWGAPESTPNPTIQVNFYSNGWGVLVMLLRLVELDGQK